MVAGHGDDTDTGLFQPDEDYSTTTGPLDEDSDDDGFDDGEEDTNHNGRLDSGESDSSDENSYPLAQGDIDGNGVVDLTDVVLSLQIVAGIFPAQAIYDVEADVNGDSKIGIEDAVFALDKTTDLSD